MVNSGIVDGIGSKTERTKFFAQGIRHTNYRKGGRCLTWQYSSTGSMICFQIVSTTACSSFEDSWGTTPPIPGAAPAMVCAIAPNSEAEGDRRSSPAVKAAVSGVAMALGAGTTAFGVRRDKLASTDDGDGEDAKKLEMNVYSEVELSMKTRNSERSRASTGSFCHLLVRKTFQGKVYSTNMVLVIRHEPERATRPIDPPVLQSINVNIHAHSILQCCDAFKLLKGPDLRRCYAPMFVRIHDERIHTLIELRLRAYRRNPVS